MPRSFFKFKSIPRSAISETALSICLKCAFDFFIEELNLSPGEAYSQLKNHTPEQADFSGAATARPHFFNREERRNCPFCQASKRWFAAFHACQIYTHKAYEKARAKVWARLETDPGRFALSAVGDTKMEVFSLWLEELKHRVGYENPNWWIETVASTISFFEPSIAWDTVSPAMIRQITCKASLSSAWLYADGCLQVSPALYGDALLVDHLISRGLPRRRRRREQRLSLQDFCKRLKRLGYLNQRGIQAETPHLAFEQAVESLVASSPLAVYYAVDRADYMKRLKVIYKKYLD